MIDGVGEAVHDNLTEQEMLMSDLGVPEDTDGQPLLGTRRLVPMQVGGAVVYIEPFDEPVAVQEDGNLRPVGADPRQAFETASDALKECIRVVGERIATVGSALKPDKVTMEFTLSFDVEGKATIVPVLLTGKAKSAVGIKVSAEWQLGGAAAQAPR